MAILTFFFNFPNFGQSLGGSRFFFFAAASLWLQLASVSASPERLPKSGPDEKNDVVFFVVPQCSDLALHEVCANTWPRHREKEEPQFCRPPSAFNAASSQSFVLQSQVLSSTVFFSSRSVSSQPASQFALPFFSLPSLAKTSNDDSRSVVRVVLGFLFLWCPGRHYSFFEHASLLQYSATCPTSVTVCFGFFSCYHLWQQQITTIPEA